MTLIQVFNWIIIGPFDIECRCEALVYMQHQQRPAAGTECDKVLAPAWNKRQGRIENDWLKTLADFIRMSALIQPGSGIYQLLGGKELQKNKINKSEMEFKVMVFKGSCMAQNKLLVTLGMKEK